MKLYPGDGWLILIEHPWCTSIFFRTTNWTKPLATVNPKIATDIDWA